MDLAAMLCAEMLGAAPSVKAQLYGSLLSLTAWLRWADARVPISTSLCCTGVALLLLGVGFGACAVVAAQPWTALVLAGAACLALAALAHHGGLVAFLPSGLQELLLRTTPFDLLFGHGKLANLTRRWGRMLLLCYRHSEGDVQTIIRGLDQDFLDQVLRQGTVSMLPGVVRSLLLPSVEHPMQAGALQPPAGLQEARWCPGGLGLLVLRCAKLSKRNSRNAQRLDLSPAGIHELLCRKLEDRQRQITAPKLAPVLGKLLPQAVQQVTVQGLQVVALSSAASAGVCISSAILFCLPVSVRGMLRVMAFGAPASAGGGERTNRWAFLAVGLSLAGASTSLALAATHIRQSWLPEIVMTSDTVGAESPTGPATPDGVPKLTAAT